MERLQAATAAVVALLACCALAASAAVVGQDGRGDTTGDSKTPPPQRHSVGGAPAVQWGSPWPMPLQYSTTETLYAVRSAGFQFNILGDQCEVLLAAVDRYYDIIFGRRSAARPRGPELRRYQPYGDDETISSLDVSVLQPCESIIGWNSDESYDIEVTDGKATLSSATVWGALRGLETFSQLVYESWYDSHDLYLINETSITDKPRFSHRGFLLDTSRHFIAKEIIMQVLEAMAQNKLNVFHWHIVDDQSFPYQSATFPDLSRFGAYDQYTHVYTAEDVQDILEFARLRGIRVVPEFDSPGHTQSWGKGQPDLLTPCYSELANPDGTYGPVNPTLNGTYDFLQRLFKEVLTVFPDGTVHLGGDEVSFDCWKSNPDVTKWMQVMGFGSNYTLLESYYIQNVLDIIAGLGPQYKYIVWEEIFDNGNKIKPDTVVEVWIDDGHVGDKLAKITQSGYRALLSSCWYLNYISYGEDWLPFYKCDPQNFNGTDQQKDLVIGGEICMWAEFVDGTNVMTRTWPRASVAAERLWSAADVTNVTSATVRLETHRCRMLGRGLDVEPVNGPGFCPYEKQSVAPRFGTRRQHQDSRAKQQRQDSERR